MIAERFAEDEERFVAGNEQFREIFERLFPSLLKRSLGSLDSESAHDVVSQTLYKLWDKKVAVPCTEVNWRRLHAFANRICDGYVANELRSQRRLAALIERATSEECGNPGRVVPDVAEWVAGVDASRVLLRNLSEQERVLVSLLVEGRRAAEIATQMGCSSAAVSMRISRLRARLRTLN